MHQLMSNQRHTGMLLSCAAIAIVIGTSGCTQLPKMHMPSVDLARTLHLSKSKNSAAASGAIDGDLSLGRLAERRGNNKRAKEIFKSVLKVSPENRLANHRLAVIAAKEGQLEKSLNHFRAAQAGAGEDSAELLGDLGYIEYLMGNLQAAENSLSRSLDLDATNTRTLNNLGLVTGMMGKSRESFSYFEQAVGTAEAHANLAYVLSQRGSKADLAQAANHYHLALENDNELKIAAHALMQIQRRLPRRPVQMPAREMQLASAGDNDWRQQAAGVMPQMTRDAIASTASQREEVDEARPAPPAELPIRDTVKRESDLLAEQSSAPTQTKSSVSKFVQKLQPTATIRFAADEQESVAVAEPAPSIELVNHESPSSTKPKSIKVFGAAEPGHFTQPESAEAIITPARPVMRPTAHSTSNESVVRELPKPEPNAEPIVQPVVQPAQPIVLLGNSFNRPLAFEL